MITARTILKFSLLLSAVFFISGGLFAGFANVNDDDFDPYPRLVYEFRSLEANLSYSPENRSVNGSVLYKVQPRIAGAGKLELHAGSLDIKKVRVNGEEVSHTHKVGILEISVPDNITSAMQSFELEISYASLSKGVFNVTPSGTHFTSTAPGRRADWIPVFEHPRNEFSTIFSVSLPEGKRLVSNGIQTSESADEDGRVVYRFESEQPIASTDLVFFAGNLEYSETMIGIKPARIYSEPGTLSSERRNEALREMINDVAQLQRKLRFELPGDGLSVIYLQDHMWEPRLSVASMVIVPLNSSDSRHLLRRGLINQWFGVRQRAATIHDMRAQVFMQAALYRFAFSNGSISNFSMYDSPDHAFTGYSSLEPQLWPAVYAVAAKLDSAYLSIIENSLQDLIRSQNAIFSWDDYRRFWYGRSGVPFPEFPELNINGLDEPGSERILNAAIEIDREKSMVRLVLEPRSPLTRDTLKVPVLLFERGGDYKTKMISMYRTGGEFSISYETPPQNVVIDASVFDDLRFFEMKNLDMWLFQLRSDPSPVRRAEAAKMMPRFRDDPDIQLAMQDFIRRETVSEVRTAMIRSLSDIVEGASGTQQVFIEMSRNARGEELQAAIDALWHYKGNEAVISAVGRIAQNSENVPAAVSAISVFRRVASEEKFNELARSILVSGSRPAAVRAAALEELYRLDDMDTAVFTSLDILERSNFPYAMRSTALRMLARHGKAEEIAEVMPLLITDADARLRYEAVGYFEILSENMRNNLLETVDGSERDPRVRAALQKYF
ncbi:MAG: hypothetical protein LAT67_06200 [Balneolales bacterium]|nr:hypothetical protein [Balneolales bacterium]